MRVRTIRNVAWLAVLTAGCNQQPASPQPTAEALPAKPAAVAPPPLELPSIDADASPATESLAAAETAFASLFAAAKDADFEAWAAAEQSLTELGTEAVPVLAKHLGDDDSLARELAVQFLAQLGPGSRAAEAELTQALDDASLMVQVNAAATLLAINSSPGLVESKLRELMRSDDPTVRLPAAISLAENQDAAEDAIATLTDLLADEHDDSVRLPAVEALGRLGESAKPSLNAVRLLTGSDNADLQTAARDAARKIEGTIDETSETIPVGGVEP